MFALIYDNVVVQIAADPFDVHPSLIWIECTDDIKVGFLYDSSTGVFSAPPVAQKTTEEIINEYNLALQSHIDMTAQSKQYKDGFACASYYNSTIPNWALDAQIFITWRDNVWIYALEILNQSNIENAPTIEEFLINAPKINW